MNYRTRKAAKQRRNRANRAMKASTIFEKANRECRNAEEVADEAVFAESQSRELAQTGARLDAMPPEAVFGECQRLVSLNGSTKCLPRRWRRIYTELLSARKP
jgi:hypothetical protein